MEYLLGLALLGWATTCFLFLRYLSIRDERERTERSVLLSRIQHPDRVPTQDFPEPDGIQKHIAFDDDEAYKELADERRDAWLS